MADDHLDRELARRFEELRAGDDRGAPSFRTLMNRSGALLHGDRPRFRIRPLPAAAIAAAAASLAVFLLLRPPGRPAASDERTAAIAEWKSPTELLLETPGSELYGPPPPASQPIPAWVFELERPAQGTPAPSTPRPKGAAS